MKAYVYKKRIVEFGESLFSNCSQNLADFLYDIKNEINEETDNLDEYPFIIDDEFGGLREDWEIEREWLENVIKYIKKNKNLNDIAFYGFTYKEVITNFEYWLDATEDKKNFSSPEFVYISWF